MKLVIVESPAKAKTIKGFLGKDFVVESSIGHIRDMPKKDMGIDINNSFKPIYEVSPDKKQIVSKLKKLAKTANTIYLATDEDREGESIAWHLLEALNLPKDTNRIVFHEITKPAIKYAITNPRAINKPLVNAQQARRIIDRLVGFEISPILWKKISGAKSAGRVQSPVVRLVVEREQEISNFKAEITYKVKAELISDNNSKFLVKLNKSFANKQQTEKFVKHLLNAKLQITDIKTKPSKKSPSAPFMTSTLQQEASQKLGFSVKQTMTLAQKLYRDGHISYMRTDSLNLSNMALASAKNVITSQYGPDYAKTRHYKTKNNSAQEAHEAIRPTDVNKKSLGANNKEEALYNIIRKRTLASQMSSAILDKTKVTISIDNRDEVFIAEGEVLKFAGFLKVYDIDTNKDKLLPELQINQVLTINTLDAKETLSKPKSRYTEASLVKKIEDMGIGRPSTFAAMISTVQERGYIIKESVAGIERECDLLQIKQNKFLATKVLETFNNDKNKLLPTSVAYLLTDFLKKYFNNIIDYKFSASLEVSFDKIASENKIWHKVVSDFYNSFHNKVELANNLSKQELDSSRIVGIDPNSGKEITIRLGRYGAFAQIGAKEDEQKPIFASLKKGQNIATISLAETLELFKMPRIIGNTDDGLTIKANYGRFGPYIQYGKKYVSLKDDSPESVSLETALKLITDKEKKDRELIIKAFKDSDIKILNGRFGAYINNGKKRGKGQKNITIKKFFGDKEPKNLSLAECQNAINGKITQIKKSKPKTKRKKNL